MSKAKKITIQQKNTPEDRLGLVYARVSSKRQETEGSGLQSQEGRCIKELDMLKIPYVKTFSDSYSGGGDFMNRPAMREMIAYIDAHPYQKFIVIFDDLKRFARDTEFHFKLRTAFKVRDVIPKCLNFSFDDSPEGIFSETIFAAHGQLEREQNRRQVIQKQKARLELGYWAFTSRKPYRMTKDPVHGNILKLENPQAQWLKEAMEGFASGRFTRKIDACRFLVEKGYWKNQKPERYIDNLTLLFKDILFAGYIEYPEWEVARRLGHHEPLISLETYEIIQKRMKGEGLNKRIRKDISDDFPLRGLLNCAYCEKPLTGAWSAGRNQKYPYYFCQNKDCGYKQKSILKKDVEDKFDEVLKKQSMKEELGILTQEVFGVVWEDEILEIKNNQRAQDREKEEMEIKLDSLTELVIKAKNDVMREAYEKQAEVVAVKLKEFNNERCEDLDLSTPYRTALNKATCFLEHPHFIWSQLSTKEQQDMFYFIFTEKLPYDIKEGYRTEHIPSAVRLFEEFTENNSLCTPDVEMAGIEPACTRCFFMNLRNVDDFLI